MRVAYCLLLLIAGSLAQTTLMTGWPKPETTPKITAEPENTAEPEGTSEPENTPGPEGTSEPENTPGPEGTSEPENTKYPNTDTPPNACDKACYEIYSPWCGSDGKTYDNDCYFGVAQCKAKMMNQKLDLKSRGRCEDIRTTPATMNCNDMICPAVYEPVCGSDGQTYSNPCVLGVAACKYQAIGKDLKMMSKGQCQKVDKCSNICPAVYMPVCGSDGRTYGNECNFKGAQCKARQMNQMLTLVSKTACDKTLMTKSPLDCARMCVDVYVPVCGSDGITYSNLCQFSIAQCEAKMQGGKALTLVSKTKCGEVVTKAPLDLCDQMCFAVYQPVCGSDGRTYSNKCQFSIGQCKAKVAGKVLTLVSKTRCGATLNPCAVYQYCAKYYKPVCGSDGKSYGNECFLKQAICRDQLSNIVTKLSKAYDGVCKSPTNTPLTKSPVDPCHGFCLAYWRPVCGSNQMTYSNICYFGIAQCKAKMNNQGLTVAYQGACTSTTSMGPKTTLSVKDQCAQHFKSCPTYTAQVCGSDGLTYNNMCEFARAECEAKLSGSMLGVSNMGACEV